MNTVKSFYTKYLKPWVKALASAIGGALAGLLINWVQGTTPIPTTKEEWVTLLIATLGPPILTLFAPANKITQKQIDKDPNVLGGIVVTDSQIPTPTVPPSSGQRPSSWR